MKLRNKKSGEIIEPGSIANFFGDYDSLAELNEEWEDVEDTDVLTTPKEHWTIAGHGQICQVSELDEKNLGDEVGKRKELGNYFKTKEEAEKAVEKLKAWKRLKESGFKFTRIDLANSYIRYEVGMHNEINASQVVDDLESLFGGEDE